MQKPQPQQVFSIETDQQFTDIALQVFHYQAQYCAVYKQFIGGLNIDVTGVTELTDIPFLPIEFFKNHQVLSNTDGAEVTFTSSGTTGMITSSHLVTDVSWYQQSFRRAFELFYGDIKQYCVLALLPAYLERAGSSLVYMADDLIKQSGHPDSGFYLYNHEELHQQLLMQQKAGTPTLLIGVTCPARFCGAIRHQLPQPYCNGNRRHERPTQRNDP
jgi:hypothetical protein